VWHINYNYIPFPPPKHPSWTSIVAATAAVADTAGIIPQGVCSGVVNAEKMDSEFQILIYNLKT
jgi:hypothetical protein